VQSGRERRAYPACNAEATGRARERCCTGHKPVIVAPDADAPYGAMVAVMDELRQGKETLSLEDDIAIALPVARERALYGF
jgi:hypothetical protein